MIVSLLTAAIPWMLLALLVAVLVAGVTLGAGRGQAGFMEWKNDKHDN